MVHCPAQVGESVDDFAGAVTLLTELEALTLTPHTPTSPQNPSNIDTGPVSETSRALVRADATQRIGELAVTAMGLHGSEAIEVWQQWATRSPEAQVAMLRGLLK